MSREELEVLKVAELTAICKEKGICHYKGKNRFTKKEMVEAILGVSKDGEDPVAQQEDTNKTTGVSQLPGTPKYLENIEVGNLVAFKEESGRLNTAMVKNASFKRKQLRLETKYGKVFVVSFDNIIWVKTKDRWPRFVLDILKQQQRKRDKNGKDFTRSEERQRAEAASN